MRTICCVFSGRKDRMTLTMKYLNQALDKNIFDEIHLWDYTRSLDDEAWIKTLTGDRIKIMTPKDKGDKWREPWFHYGESEYENDIIFKIDDDMVFINVENLKLLKKNAIEHRDNNSVYMFIPAMINSISGNNLLQYNVNLPTSGRSGNIDFASDMWGMFHGDLAFKQHLWFLINHAKVGIIDKIIRHQGDLHTHICVTSGKKIQMLRGYITRDDWHDEIVNTKTLTRDKNIHNIILPIFGGSHLTFGSQEKYMNTKLLLEMYEILSKNYS